MTFRCSVADPVAAKRAEQSAGIASAKGVTGKRGYIGGNFGLPHRDFSYDEAYAGKAEDGADVSNVAQASVREESRDGTGGQLPRVLSTWMPLTPVRTDNGCMCTPTLLR